MTFLWPLGLWLLLLVPALVAGYGLLLRRNADVALRHPGFTPLHRPGRVAPHVPPVLFLLAILLLLLAAARPATHLWLPSDAATVILAIDVSGSMRAADIAPTRLGAAKAAAREFVVAMPPGVSIGIVTFSTEARLVLEPALEREDILRALDSLAAEEETAIGSGILVALDALQPAADATDLATAVILLTDGQNSHGPDPIEVARRAAKRAVRVYTIGIGTAHGRIRDERGWSTVVGIDEESLKEIARLTGAEYSYAQSAWHLKRIYAALGSKVVLARMRTEIGALLCALAALAGLAAVAVSLTRSGRVL